MQLAELPKDFAGALIARFGPLDGHLDNLVAALVGTRIQDALFPQAKALAGVSPLRDLQLGTAVDGRHIDFGAERGLPDGERNLDFNIVAVAMKEGMLFHLGGDVEVAGRRPLGSGIAFTGHAQARAIPRAGWNADIDGFGAGHAAIARARGAGVTERAGTAAAGAGEVEPHGSRHLGHVAGAFALRTGDFSGARRTRAAAGVANLVARDIQTGLRSSDGLPEIDVHHVLEVAALFRFGLLRGSTPPPEELRKDIAEAAPGFGPGAAFRSGSPSGHVRKIEPSEIHSGMGAMAGRTCGTGAGEAAFRRPPFPVRPVARLHPAPRRIAKRYRGSRPRFRSGGGFRDI